MLTPGRPRSRSAIMARSTISARCAPSSRPRAIVFRTESDTEVILAAWRQWGPDCLARFNGMFAFALYDAGRRLAVPRPRPARREAALLCRAFRRRADLRFGAEGAARPSAAAPRARARRRSRIISPSAMSPTTPRSSKACASFPPAIILLVRRGRPVPQPVSLVGRRFLQPGPQLRQGARGGNGRAPARRGPLADGRRRAARRLPLGRRRQLGGGRLHGRSEPRRGRDLLDRLRRGRS